MKEETSYTCSNDNLVILFHNVVVVAVVVRRLKGWRLKFQLVGLRGVKPECPEISCFQGQVVLQFNWFKKKNKFCSYNVSGYFTQYVCLFVFFQNKLLYNLFKNYLVAAIVVVVVAAARIVSISLLFSDPFILFILLKLFFCLFLQQYYIL